MKKIPPPETYDEYKARDAALVAKGDEHARARLYEAWCARCRKRGIRLTGGVLND